MKSSCRGVVVIILDIAHAIFKGSLLLMLGMFIAYIATLLLGGDLQQETTVLVNCLWAAGVFALCLVVIAAITVWILSLKDTLR